MHHRTCVEWEQALGRVDERSVAMADWQRREGLASDLGVQDSREAHLLPLVVDRWHLLCCGTKKRQEGADMVIRETAAQCQFHQISRSTEQRA